MYCITCEWGGIMASRSVTHILSKAYANGHINIPFHRIVYADGCVWIDEKYAIKRKNI